MRLVSAAVDRYGPLSGFEPPCADDLTIVAGPNESGKTLFLEGLLRLLDPDVTAHMDPGPRVDGSPVGRVVVTDGDDRHDLGDGTTLGDVSRIEPHHLSTLFVVRDGDLALPETSAYYTSLVEYLGDVHTSEIDDVREGLLETGRLTASRLDLADREYDTKTAKADADALAADIEAYVERSTTDGTDDLARRRRALRAERRSVATALETQETARELATLDEAASHLETYRTATETIRSTDVDRETLDELRTLSNDAEHASGRITELDDDLDRKRTALDRHRNAVDRTRDRRTELAQREAAVSNVEAALDDYRERRDPSGGDEATEAFDSRLALRRLATAAGLVGAGIAGGVSALVATAGGGPGPVAAVVAGLALAVAVVAWASHRRLAARAAESSADEATLLRAARDAGFDVDEVTEIPVRIRAYRDELDGVRTRVRELDERVSQTADRVAELEADRRAAVEERDRLRAELEATLRDADVDSIEAYERRVERVETADRRRSNAAVALSTELGDPDETGSTGAADRESVAASPNHGAKIDRWEAALADRRAAVDADGIEPDAYDEAEHERLGSRLDDIDAELADVEAALDDHRDRLDAFERRVGDLSLPPFVDSAPSLQARTVDGLRAVADELRDVSAAIEDNAELSRKAIEVLDEMRDAEERKAAALFAPDGPASETFAHLTDGRYAGVAYDPDAETISVERADGAALPAEQLSKGTRDQLYFAARLSLARQVLGGRPGFLLLDDPFLAADRTRLRNGFETLRTLADDGWQVLYFTAKPEVSERMADEFACTVHEMEPLSVPD
ncbi:ATP-binding protein [Halovivax cerinus]|uniref:ATP-binding protein n=1 Tax=Halovivax cerinus TaxID=1487865 RepID=A0ABD5NQZ2_9EURY|nr:hypothetical protein [Halovivax cerinus]